MFRFAWILAALLGLATAPAAWSQGGEIGVVLLHGKSSGPKNPVILKLASTLESNGHLVSSPNMAWSRTRMYDASFDASMSEIDQAVQALRQQGAKKVFVAGHSMGANAALGYAAHRGGADGIIAMAPGHTPELGSTRDNAASDVRRAKELIAEGKGNEPQQFSDTNQGKQSRVTATADVYLSWFDPDGPAVMPKSAAALKQPLPLLVIEGSRETLAKGQSYFFTKAPEHPASKFTTVDADHNGLPAESGEVILAWLASFQ